MSVASVLRVGKRLGWEIEQQERTVSARISGRILAVPKTSRSRPRVSPANGAPTNAGHSYAPQTGETGRSGSYVERDGKVVVRYIKPCSVSGCARTAVSWGWCDTHYYRWRKNGDVSIVKTRPAGSGSIGSNGYLVFRSNGEYVFAHIQIAEKALGRKMPKGAEVHHVDENKLNNANANLIICPDRAYHFLLHRRMDALNACGHADWRTCNICHQYDDIKNLRLGKSSAVHPACARNYYQQRRNLCLTIS